jgi:hypothetical protein|eukprot:COSAG06_NODE_9814_length_1810_cov_1.453536_2_plen_160_part_00
MWCATRRFQTLFLSESCPVAKTASGQSQGEIDNRTRLPQAHRPLCPLGQATPSRAHEPVVHRCGKRLFAAIFEQKRSIYQDRLWTNLGRAQEFRESKNVVLCSRPGERHLVRRRAGLQGRSLGQGDGAKNASRFQYDLTLQCSFDTTNDRFSKTGSGQT